MASIADRLGVSPSAVCHRLRRIEGDAVRGLAASLEQQEERLE